MLETTPPAAPPPSTPPPPPSAPPQPPALGAPRAAVVAAGAAAIVAAGSLSWDRPGAGWLLTALAAVAAILLAVRSGRRATPAGRSWSRRATIGAVWATAGAMLIAVGAVRAAGWLFALCVLAAGLVGCVALTDRRSIAGLLLAPPRVAGSVPAALRWLVRDWTRPRAKEHDTSVRTLVAGLIAVALLLVFGLLLAGADAAFAQILSAMAPSWNARTLLRWAWSAAVVLTVTATATYVLLTRKPTSEEDFRPRLVRRIEWALPVGALVVLFAGFVAVQATVLFGGAHHVLHTGNLTYAEYARSGFWQLLVVTGLTVIVVGVAAQVAPRSTAADRMLLRVLLGLLSALSLVIVASALSRMAAYEQAYGFTRRRLLVTTCELWLGVLFLLILVAGVRLRGRWVPRAALAAAVAALLGLAVLNPDAFIARHNIARAARPDQIDVNYLATLSADAIPALESLPEPYRSCALAAIDKELTGGRPDAWFEWNLARHTARAELRAHPPAPVDCPR